MKDTEIRGVAVAAGDTAKGKLKKKKLFQFQTLERIIETPIYKLRRCIFWVEMLVGNKACLVWIVTTRGWWKDRKRFTLTKGILVRQSRWMLKVVFILLDLSVNQRTNPKWSRCFDVRNLGLHNGCTIFRPTWLCVYAHGHLCWWFRKLQRHRELSIYGVSTASWGKWKKQMTA